VESEFQTEEETADMPKVTDAVCILVPYAEPNIRTKVLPEATKFVESVPFTAKIVAGNTERRSKHPLPKVKAIFPPEADALGVFIMRELDEIQRENSEVECWNLDDKLKSILGICVPMSAIKLDPVNAETASETFAEEKLKYKAVGDVVE